MEWKEKFREKFFEIWLYLARLTSFVEIFENTVPFDTGNHKRRFLSLYITCFINGILVV